MNSLTIACDESGAEGEAVLTSAHPVFTHASTDLSQAEADDVLAALRERSPSTAKEIKADYFSKPSRKEALAWFTGEQSPLIGRSMIYCVDKEYFIAAKIVDLLVEELLHEQRLDIYSTGLAFDYAQTLRVHSGEIFGEEGKASLLQVFNSLMRAKQRKGTKASVADFFQLVSDLLPRSRGTILEDVMLFLYNSRRHADIFQESLIDDPLQLPALDPLVAAIGEAARSWSEGGTKMLHIIHDEQSSLTPTRISLLQEDLQRPHPDFRQFHPPVTIDNFELKKSHDDSRIQVADLLAGIAREDATELLGCSLGGVKSALLQDAVSQNSLWVAA